MAQEVDGSVPNPIKWGIWPSFPLILRLWLELLVNINFQELLASGRLDAEQSIIFGEVYIWIQIRRGPHCWRYMFGHGYPTHDHFPTPSYFRFMA